MTESRIYVMPAGEAWSLQDEEIRALREKLLEAEERLAHLRGMLNTAIFTRRTTLRRDDTVVCPVCGAVTEIHVGTVAPHDSIRGRQCRGTGIGWAARYTDSGGL